MLVNLLLFFACSAEFFILKSFKTQVQEFIKDKEKGHGKQKDLRGSFINTKLNHIMVKAILAQLVTVNDIAC